MKHKKNVLSRIITQHKQLIAVGIVVTGLFTTLFYKRSTYAASDRAKTAAAVIVGGGAVGGLASIGGAKWFPLGFVGGGLAFGLIARNAIRKNRERRAAAGIEPYNPQLPRYRRRGRAHIQTDAMVPVAGQPYPSANYINQRNINEPY